MKRTLVRYKIKPERVQDNALLIKRVFDELKARSPDKLAATPTSCVRQSR